MGSWISRTLTSTSRRLRLAADTTSGRRCESRAVLFRAARVARDRGARKRSVRRVGPPQTCWLRQHAPAHESWDCVARRDLSWAWMLRHRLSGQHVPVGRCCLSTPTISESASAIVVHARGARGGVTKRVGSANMHLFMKVGTARRSAAGRGREGKRCDCGRRQRMSTPIHAQADA
jgi:hypothetical protein